MKKKIIVNVNTQWIIYLRVPSKFRTRDGRMAIYSTDDTTGVYVYLEGYRTPIPYHYDGTPKITGIPFPKVDIISKWQVPLSDEELDKLASEYAENNHRCYACHDDDWYKIKVLIISLLRKHIRQVSPKQQDYDNKRI